MLQAINKNSLYKLAPSVFTMEAHASTSNKYQHISTIEIIDALEKEGFVPTWAGQSNTRIAGKELFAKHMIRFRHNSLIGQSKTLYPEIVLTNSHDGLSSYRLNAGLFRLVCTNGLIAGTNWEEIRVRHQGNICENVLEGTLHIVDNSNNMIKSAIDMSSVQLTKDEKLFFAEAVHSVKFSEESNTSIAINPERFLTPRRIIDQSNDLFTVLNVVQENIIRGGITGHFRQNGRMKRATTRPVNSIDQNVKLNKALWTLAEKMRELKG